jgi:RNase adaptor protein for sRNA GlmZ degradation
MPASTPRPRRPAGVADKTELVIITGMSGSGKGTVLQSQEFIERISDLLIYLLPHYIEEGKSYLTISFGCTGGHHRSVMIAHELRKRLSQAGYRVKETHRDVTKKI